MNGGQPLSISAGTKHPKEAWTYIKYMSSKGLPGEVLRERPADLEVALRRPEGHRRQPRSGGRAKIQYNYFVSRPAVPYYSELSTFLQVGIQQALLGKKSSADVLKEAQAKALELAKKK